MIAIRKFLCLTAVAASASLGSSARAAVIVATPDYPPIGQDFIAAPGDVLTYLIPGATVTVSNVVIRTLLLNSRIQVGADEQDSFNVSLAGDLSVNGSPPAPASGTGPSTARLAGKWGNATGTFNTEMLQLDISGTSPFGPFQIRESPTLVSSGVTTITNLGGGGYQIDSFFDVFTQLSIDGGANWFPESTGPIRVDLGGAVPEPTVLGLLGLSLLGVLRRSRRQA